MTGIIARRLLPGDERLAADVVNKCKLEEDGEDIRIDTEFIAGFLAVDSNYLVAAYEGDAPLGFALGYSMPCIWGRTRMMYVHEVGVISSRRREGIGKMVMQAMIDVCRNEGHRKMFLTTGVNNEPAIALYASTGGNPSTDDDPPLGFGWDLANE